MTTPKGEHYRKAIARAIRDEKRSDDRGLTLIRMMVIDKIKHYALAYAKGNKP